MNFLLSSLLGCQRTTSLPRKNNANWIIDEVKHLSLKKEIWLRYWMYHYKINSNRHAFNHAHKKRNSWWSNKAVRAEEKAKVSQQLGSGGSMIKGLKKKQVYKPSSSQIIILYSDIKMSRALCSCVWLLYFGQLVWPWSTARHLYSHTLQRPLPRW